MSDLTLIKAARILKTISIARDPRSTDTEYYSKQAAALDFAASILCRVGSGELLEVVHGQWVSVKKECYDITDEDEYPSWKYCSNCKTSQRHQSNYCPSCGALMDESDMRQTQDGKDDRHAEK